MNNIDCKIQSLFKVQLGEVTSRGEDSSSTDIQKLAAISNYQWRIKFNSQCLLTKIEFLE